MASESDPGSRMKGTVKWFSDQKGFGFVTPDDGSDDLFVHQSAIRSEGFRSLSEGESVEFEVETGDDGRTKAVNVSGPDGAPVKGTRSGGGDRYGGDGGGRYGGGDGGGYGGGRYGGDGGYGGGGGRYVGGGGGGYGGGRGGSGCYKCGEEGHFARDCTQGGGYGGGGGGGGGYGGGGGRYGGSGGGGGGSGGGCFNCGEEGHFARECPNSSNR